MTPEEHFEKAEHRLSLFNERFAEDDEAPLSAELHIALGRAKSEHEARKDFAERRLLEQTYPQAPAPALMTAPLPWSPETGRTPAAWEQDIKALNGTINALRADTHGLAGQVDDLSAACAQKDQEIKRLTELAVSRFDDLKANAEDNERLAAQVKDTHRKCAERASRIRTLEQEYAQRGREIDRLNGLLRQKETHLTDLSNAHKSVSKQWTERGDRILTLEHEVKSWKSISDKNAKRAKELEDKLAKFTSPNQPTPLTDGLPAVPEGFFRLVVDAPNGTVLSRGTVEDFGGERVTDPLTLLKDSQGEPAKVIALRVFKRTEDVQATPLPGAEFHSKARIVYGQCRPAEQVWRTPAVTRWKGYRSGWGVEYDAPSEVTAVYVRSVDYPDTGEVGVELVTLPKDAPEGGMVDHERLIVLAGKKMTAAQWRNSEFEHDSFDRD